MTEHRPPRRPRPETGPPDPYRYAGRPLPSRQPYGSRAAHGRDDSASAGGGRVVGVLLAVTTAALIVLHGLWQVTAPAAAGRMLRAVLPPLTDLDQTLAANRETLREVAAGLQPGETAAVPGLPLPVEVTRDQALNADTATLRTAVLARMSDQLYQSGASAFRAAGASAGSPSLLGSQWVLQGTLNLLTERRHEALRLPHLAAIGVAALLALAALWLNEGPARLIGPGVSLVAGAAFAALVTGGAWGLTYLLFSSGDVVDTLVRRVARDSSITVLLVALTFAALGVIVTGLGLLARRLDNEPVYPSPVADRRVGPKGGG